MFLKMLMSYFQNIHIILANFSVEKLGVYMEDKSDRVIGCIYKEIDACQ